MRRIYNWRWICGLAISGAFDAKNSRTYGTAFKELVQEKLKGHTIIANETERPSGGNVVI